MFKRVLLLAVVSFFVGNVFADQVFFKNGDRVSGKIEQVRGGQLVIVSEIAGKVTVSMDKVRTFKTDGPVKLHLSEDETVNRRIEASRSELAEINIVSESDSRLMALDEIYAINLPVIKYPVWSGDITAGYNSKHGNTKSSDASVHLNLKRHTKSRDLTLTGEHLFSQEEKSSTDEKITTEDSWLFKAKDQYKISKRNYGYYEGSYEKDRVAELDRRIIAGLGFGRKFIDKPNTHFQADVGLAHIDERYADSTSNNSVAGQLGYYMDHQINGKVKFIHDMAYYPGLEDSADYYLKTKAELRFDVTKRLFTSVKVVLDYDAVPADGAKTTDVKYLLGMGYKF